MECKTGELDRNMIKTSIHELYAYTSLEITSKIVMYCPCFTRRLRMIIVACNVVRIVIIC
jgi:hypothetical protein